MIQVKHDDSLVFNKRNQLFPNMQIYNRLKNNGARHHYLWEHCPKTEI